MENEEKEIVDASNQPEEVALETTVETEEETIEEVRAKLAKAEEIAKNQKIRAEKAESLAKSVKTVEAPKPSPKAGELSTKDIYALMDAKVPEQDIEKVQEIATLKGISVAEAIKLPLTRQILSDEAEQRNTASAANVGGSKRSSSKISDEVLLAKAQKGELPTSDEDIMRLTRIRKGYKN